MNVVLQAAASSPIFAGTTAPYLLLDPRLTIRAVNAAYLQATCQTPDSIVGRAMFDAFPDNPDVPSADGVRKLSASLANVLDTGRAHEMQIQRYDVRPAAGAGTHDGEFQERYWVPVNSPLLDESGHVAAILHHVEDVTAAFAILDGVPSVAGSAEEQVRSLALHVRRLHGAASTLGQRSSRLGDALCALAATRVSGVPGTGLVRRAALWRAVADKAEDSGWSGWCHAVCATAVECMDTVDAATLTLVGDSGTKSHLLAATNRWAYELSTLDQLVLGPTTSALSSNAAVIAERLSDEATLWRDFVDAATTAGVSAVAAYPLTISQRPFAVLTLYRRDPETRASRSEHAEASLFADLAAAAVLADLERIGDALQPNDDPLAWSLISAAARALTIRQDISYDRALSGMRTHALLNGQSTLDIANQVLRRQILRID